MINQNLFDSKQLVLKDFLLGSTRKQLWVTWIITGIFSFLTCLWIFFIWRYDLDFLEVGSNFRGLERLITGGTIRSLAIEGGQWWRIFTYGGAGFGYGTAIHIIGSFLLGTILFRLLKFNEGISGSIRTLLVFVCSYIFTGFILSVLGGPFIYGGINVLVAISTGMIVGTVNSHKNQVFDFVRYKLVSVILFLILIPLFTSTGDWIASAFGFIIGMAVMNLIYFKVHASKISLGFSVGVITILFVITLIFALVPLPYGLAEDQVVVQTLFTQASHNLGLTQSGAQTILARLKWI